MWYLFPLFRRPLRIFRQVTVLVFNCGVVVESQAKSGQLFFKRPVYECRFASGSQRGFGGFLAVLI
jgi:hypothetical protein